MPIPARYGDGRSACRHAVELAGGDGCLHVAGEQVDASYPLANLRLTEPFAHAPGIVYFDDGAYCEIDGAHYPALAAMLGLAPSLVVRWQRNWRIALAAVGALVAVIAAATVWGLPVAAEVLTALLPHSADQRIGAITRDALGKQAMLQPTTLSAAQTADIALAWRAIAPVHPRMAMSLMVCAMPASFGPNALALPDGTVILNDAMARKILAGSARFDANQAAALAGVLAHEIGHIEGRHSMRSVVRASLTTVFAAYLFGDFSAVAAGAPAILLGARHSRAMETDADSYALAALRAHHLPATPLADLFETMQAKAGDEPARWFRNATGYLSTHPGGRERAARLRAAPHD